MIKNIIKHISKFFFILSFLAILSPVYATGSNEYAKDFNTPLNLYFRDCTQGGDVCDTSVSAVRLTGTFEDGLSKSYFQTGINVVLGSNYGVNVILSTDTTLLKDYLYSITFSTCNTGAQYDYNNEFWRISSGSSISSVASSSSKPEIISSRNDVLSDYPFSTNLSFSKCFMHTMNFVPKTDSNYLGLQIRSNTQNTTKLNFIGYKIQNLGDTQKLTAEEVETIITNNNQIIQNQIDDINSNITDVENNLNQNIQDTEDRLNQSIIDSNQATQDTINNNFNECRDSYNLFNKNGDFNFGSSLHKTTLLSNGTLLSTANFKYGRSSGQLIENIKPNTDYTVSGILVSTVATDETRNAVVQILSSLNVIIKTNYFSSSLTKPYEFEFTFNSGNNTSFWISLNGVNSTSSDTSNIEVVFDKIQIQEGNSATKYEDYGEQVCTNRIDETNDKLNDLNNSINDETPPNLSALENSAGWLPPGPVDSILNLPLSLLNNLTDNLGGTCQPVILTLPFIDSDIELPCVNTIYEKIGLTPFLNWISPIVSALILFGYLINLYKWVDDTLTFRENNHIDNWGGV